MVMQATPSEEFPDAFDGIEFRAVGRQELQMKMRFMLSPPGRVQGRMVITSVVADDHDAPTRAASSDAASGKAKPPSNTAPSDRVR